MTYFNSHHPCTGHHTLPLAGRAADSDEEAKKLAEHVRGHAAGSPGLAGLQVFPPPPPTRAPPSQSSRACTLIGGAVSDPRECARIGMTSSPDDAQGVLVPREGADFWYFVCGVWCGVFGSCAAVEGGFQGFPGARQPPGIPFPSRFFDHPIHLINSACLSSNR